MSAHTPGPWSLYPQGRDSNFAKVVTSIGEEFFFACNGNASLVAAAPDISAALRVALDDLEAALPTLRAAGWQTHNEEATLRRGRAAIAKAEAA